MNQKLLLITPPFVQLNTPYPATPYLKGFLNTIDISSHQCDLGIEVILSLFSKKGLTDLFETIEINHTNHSENSARIFTLRDQYIHTIDSVILFLQNQNPTLAHRICSRNYLPEASRFNHSDDLDWTFGNMGTHDMARHLATLYLEDISDLIIETIDPNFGFSRYAEHISAVASSFDELYSALNQPLTYIDRITINILKEKVKSIHPTLIGFSVPFPGNLYSALRCGQWIKQNHPDIKCIMGGGYPNTELRSLADARVFEFIDFITLDDGEVPLINIIEYIDNKREIFNLKRTFTYIDNQLKYCNGSKDSDIHQSRLGTPNYSDLPLDKYLSTIETTNPMHRLWSDGRWNKLTLAHGCYWRRCTFCDTSLDYIKRFEPLTASILCGRIEQLINQTGVTGFHFVDEAAPPALLKSLALEIIKRKLNITWWTNIRFEINFTHDLCHLLRESGCIAISGGLEVASDRLLGLINKGTTVKQVTQVANNFTQNGIMVHAYLMYGFPTQTAQETIDSLEVVRQLFETGIVQSGFWHHFAMTAHSPIGLNPERFDVKNDTKEIGTFANNELKCIDYSGTQHKNFSQGLKTSLYNYMNGVGFELPLQDWFDYKVPNTTIAKSYIKTFFENPIQTEQSPNIRIIWLGELPQHSITVKKKKGHTLKNSQLLFHLKQKSILLKLPKDEGVWLYHFLKTSLNSLENSTTLSDMKNSFEEVTGKDFILFWNSKQMNRLRSNGLLTL